MSENAHEDDNENEDEVFPREYMIIGVILGADDVV